MNNIFQTIPGPISRPAKSTDRSRNPLWRLRRFFFACFLTGFLTIFALLAFYFQNDLGASAAELAQASHICLDTEKDCESKIALASASKGDSNRELVDSIDEVPDVILEAIIATEDKDFRNHNGINSMGIIRGVFQTAKSKVTGSGSAQGGSSITQQLVKNQYFDKTTSFNSNKTAAIARKPEEVVLAIKLERKLASQDLPCKSGQTKSDCVKDEILLRYLNVIHFGNGSDGVKTATRTYFDKDLEEITLEEAAYLAGVLRAPARAQPYNNPQEANRRIMVTLQLMLDEGYITQQELDAAVARMEETAVEAPKSDEDPTLVKVPLPEFRDKIIKEGLGEVKYSDVGSEYFVSEVWQQVDELYPGKRNTGGLKVYITMDPAKQSAAYETITSYIDNPEMPNAGLVSVDDRGLVRAMVGGTDFKETPFNYATGRGGSGRGPGSLMKPIALAAAIEEGISAKSLFTAPREIEFPRTYNNITTSEPWTVSSGGFADGVYPNYMTLEEATHGSTNSVYAQLVYRITPDKLASTAENMGLSNNINVPLPSNVLGRGTPASVMDMASVYSTFERAGKKIDPRVIQRIEDRDGNVLCWYPYNGECQAENTNNEPQIDFEQAISSDSARQVNHVLAGVVSSGTGTNAQIGRAVAGKTGTNNDNRDAWFAGYTCDLTTAIWVGYDDNRPMNGTSSPTMSSLFGSVIGGNGRVDGGDLPATMWGNYMRKAVEGVPACNTLDSSANFTGVVENSDLVSAYDACYKLVQTPVTPGQPGEPAVEEPTIPTLPNQAIEEFNEQLRQRRNNQNQKQNNLPFQDQNGQVRPASFSIKSVNLQNPNAQVPEQNNQQSQNPNVETPQSNVQASGCLVLGDNIEKRWVLSGDPGAIPNPLPPTTTPTTESEIETTTTTEEPESTTTTEEPDPDVDPDIDPDPDLDPDQEKARRDER